MRLFDVRRAHIKASAREMGAHAAGLVGARDHALISLLALNGLRVSEAIGAWIEREPCAGTRAPDVDGKARWTKSSM